MAIFEQKRQLERRREVKSDVLLPGARCLSGWPAPASYSQP